LDPCAQYQPHRRKVPPTGTDLCPRKKAVGYTRAQIPGFERHRRRHALWHNLEGYCRNQRFVPLSFAKPAAISHAAPWWQRISFDTKPDLRAVNAKPLPDSNPRARSHSKDRVRSFDRSIDQGECRAFPSARVSGQYFHAIQSTALPFFLW